MRSIKTAWTRKQYSKFSLHLISSLIFIIGISAGSYLTIANVLIPAIRALTETTQSMPTDVLFTATGHDNGSGTITVLDTEIKLATSSSWWSGEYLYQQPVTVKNLAAIAASTSAQLQLDTQTLISQSKLQNDCDDLRLTYDRYEIPRSIANCNTPTTTVTFPLQEPLPTASSSA